MNVIKKDKVVKTLREYNYEFKVSIPQRFIKSLGLKDNSSIAIELLDNKIIIRKEIKRWKKKS